MRVSTEKQEREIENSTEVRFERIVRESMYAYVREKGEREGGSDRRGER